MNTEPVLWVNMALSLIRSFLAFAVGMGWFMLTDAQLDSALVFASALGLFVDFVANWWVRTHVTPTAKIVSGPT